jgi:hypothetical protein
MTNGYIIPMDRLFANQSTYGDMDLQSQQSKEATDRINELARSAFLENMSKPFKQSLLTDFAPAEIENAQLTPNAEPYSALSVKQAPSSIVGGMFSPEISRAAEMEYLQKRQAAMRDRALAFAQLSPMQQADYGFYRGGQQLGDVVGGALGGQDPQLRMIGLQQQILSELDPSDPEQQLRVAQKYAQTAPELAMKIAESARKSMSEMALTTQRLREKQGADPFEQLLRSGKYTPASMATYKVSGNVADLREVESPDKVPADIQKARLVAQSKGLKEGTKEYNDEIVKQLEKTDKERNIAFGAEAERKSKTMYGKPYADLTPTEAGLVDKAVEASEQAKAKAGATVIPGVKEFKDIPKLRADIISTVKPFRDTVNAADSAFENIGLSMNENNFIAFNAARVQLAKAIAGGDLSQKEIQASGGDPSILGGVFDLASTAITSTPSLDTQQKIKDTIKAIRKVALQKGRAEIEAQRTLAKRSNFTDDDFDLASDIPEFRTKPSGVQKDTGLSFDAEKEKRYQEWKAKQKGTTP